MISLLTFRNRIVFSCRGFDRWLGKYEGVIMFYNTGSNFNRTIILVQNG